MFEILKNWKLKWMTTRKWEHCCTDLIQSYELGINFCPYFDLPGSLFCICGTRFVRYFIPSFRGSQEPPREFPSESDPHQKPRLSSNFTEAPQKNNFGIILYKTMSVRVCVCLIYLSRSCLLLCYILIDYHIHSFQPPMWRPGGQKQHQDADLLSTHNWVVV